MRRGSPFDFFGFGKGGSKENDKYRENDKYQENTNEQQQQQRKKKSETKPPEKENELYDLLGVPRTASTEDIKCAFRQCAKNLHPDRNKDDPQAAEKFKAVRAAYEVLMDPHKRSIYDQYGKAGLKREDEEGGSGRRQGDILSQLFGFDVRDDEEGEIPGRMKKGEDVGYKLPVSLEDLYCGNTIPVPVKRTVLCPSCEGAGTNDGSAMPKCTACGGRGSRVFMHQMGPFIQQGELPCQLCSGRGSVLNMELLCALCAGKKTVKEEKIFQVHIEKGMKNDHHIKFFREADRSPGVEPGDVIFVVKEREHEIFKRNGNDLVIEHKIKLVEALTGTYFRLTHLDKRILHVRSPPNMIIKPGDVLMVAEEGMPTHKRPFEKGSLFIRFDIVFPLPAEITAEKMALLKEALPATEDTTPKKTTDTTTTTTTTADEGTPENPSASATEKSASESVDDETEVIEENVLLEEPRKDHHDHGDGGEDSDDQRGGGGGVRYDCGNQ